MPPFNVPRRPKLYDRQRRSKDTKPWKNKSSRNNRKSRRPQNSPSASKKLEEYVATQSVPTFSDIYHFLAASLKKAQAYETEATATATAPHEAQIAYLREVHQRFIENFRVLAQNLEDRVREMRKKFDERIQQEIVKVTSDEIAEALTKRVLTVRTAARGENVDVVIRQASAAEIRASKLF